MKYIICGLEHTGFRVAETLLSLEEEVRIITLSQNESSLFYIRERLAKYVEGDARNAKVLISAGINDADFLLIFTSNEIKNIEINCKAKEINPNIKTALFINQLSYSKIIVQGFEVDFVFNIPSIVSLPIVSSCINRNILYTLNGRDSNYYFSVINCEEHPYLLNKAVKEIETEFNIKIVNNFYPDNQYSTILDTEGTINGGSLVYITNNETHFNSPIFHQKNISELIISESKKRFAFFSKFSIIPGIRKVLLLYSLLITVSVIIFTTSLKISIIDAVYFTVTTTSTVGYGDFNLQNSSFWIKVYGCFTMLAGAALLAMLFSVLTDNIISKRLGSFAGMYNRKIKNHIIVAGLGSIGLGVVNYLLKLRIKTVVIERNPENKNIVLLKNKVPILIGDASDHKVLLKARIKNAKTLASLIDDDLNNVNIILKGNSIKDDIHTVARIFSNELNRKAKGTFQIDNVISASNIAVPYIISSLIYKNVIWAGYIHNKIFSLLSLQLNAQCPLIGSKKNEKFEKTGLVPLLVKRNEEIIYIKDDLIYMENDLIYLYCEYNSLKNIKFLC